MQVHAIQSCEHPELRATPSSSQRKHQIPSSHTTPQCAPCKFHALQVTGCQAVPRTASLNPGKRHMQLRFPVSSSWVVSYTTIRVETTCSRRGEKHPEKQNRKRQSSSGVMIISQCSWDDAECKQQKGQNVKSSSHTGCHRGDKRPPLEELWYQRNSPKGP